MPLADTKRGFDAPALVLPQSGRDLASSYSSTFRFTQALGSAFPPHQHNDRSLSRVGPSIALAPIEAIDHFLFPTTATELNPSNFSSRVCTRRDRSSSRKTLRRRTWTLDHFHPICGSVFLSHGVGIMTASKGRPRG